MEAQRAHGETDCASGNMHVPLSKSAKRKLTASEETREVTQEGRKKRRVTHNQELTRRSQVLVRNDLDRQSNEIDYSEYEPD